MTVVDFSPALLRSCRLKKRVERLAELRTAEGYMAEVQTQAPGVLLLTENHCPICAAATVCQGLCGAELEVFQAVLGPDVAVERVEHILAGDRRCAYEIRHAPRRGQDRSWAARRRTSKQPNSSPPTP